MDRPTPEGMFDPTLEGENTVSQPKIDQPPTKELAKYPPENTPFGNIANEFNYEGQDAIELNWITPDGQLLPAGQEELYRRSNTIKALDTEKLKIENSKPKPKKKAAPTVHREYKQTPEQKEFVQKRKELLNLLQTYFTVQQLPRDTLKIHKIQNNSYLLEICNPTSLAHFFDKTGGSPLEILNDTIKYFETLIRK